METFHTLPAGVAAGIWFQASQLGKAAGAFLQGMHKERRDASKPRKLNASRGPAPEPHVVATVVGRQARNAVRHGVHVGCAQRVQRGTMQVLEWRGAWRRLCTITELLTVRLTTRRGASQRAANQHPPRMACRW